MSLTGKQRSFVNSYLSNFNASLSAKIAGYRATSKHSFESIGHENLNKPAIRGIIDEHFRLSKMDAEQVLMELTKLARGPGKDQIRALALLSQYHGLLDGKRAQNEEIEIRVTYATDKFNQALEAEIRTIDAQKDKQWRAVEAKYAHSEIATEALHFLRDVMAGKKSVEPEPETKPVEVEIIPPQRRLEPAPIEKMMAELVEVEAIQREPTPTPPRCRHGYTIGQCHVIDVGKDQCPHWYKQQPKQSDRDFFMA